MSKVILISPPEQHLLMEAGDRPNLGLLYLAGALRKTKHQVILSDLNHDSYHTLEGKIRGFNPEFIGITTITPYYNWVIQFSNHLRSNYPKIKLIAGGPHATVLPESLKENFDFIVKGEGEKAIVDIVEGREKSQIVERGFEKNLDNLARPARDLLPLGSRYGINQLGVRATTALTSRSCPFDCFFCTKNILGSKQRTHGIDYVVDELKEIRDRFGFKGIYFLDDCFTANKDRAYEFADRVKNMGLNFRIITRSDRVNFDLLKQLKKAGLHYISFGLEHMDNKVLEGINKHNTIEHNIQAVRDAHKLGLAIRGSFILNLPNATPKTMYKTLQFAIDERLEFADFYPLIAYPGTRLWNTPEKYGMRMLNKDFNFYQTCGVSNVELMDFPNNKFLPILKDIQEKWRRFKGTKTPWEFRK